MGCEFAGTTYCHSQAMPCSCLVMYCMMARWRLPRAKSIGLFPLSSASSKLAPYDGQITSASKIIYILDRQTDTHRHKHAHTQTQTHVHTHKVILVPLMFLTYSINSSRQLRSPVIHVEWTGVCIAIYI